MKTFRLIASPSIYVEFDQNSMKVLDGEDGLELSLDRQENGRITPACEERLISSLRIFLKKHQWRPRLRALCAIGARGVSVRRLTLPAASEEDVQRLLPLQIEREFPLLPEELAWGYRPLGPERVSGNGTPAVQELLVIAVKRDVIDHYATILSGCGLNPTFTLGALARNSLSPQHDGTYGLLDISQHQSELIAFENGVPGTIRLLPWGRDQISREIESIGQSIDPKWIGQTLYVTGENAQEIAARLAKVIHARCEPIRITPGEGRSAAILGLKKSWEQNGSAQPLLLLQTKNGKDRELGAGQVQWKWAIAAVLLLLGSIGLRYAGPVFQQARLAKRLAMLQASRENFPKIDRELGFLQYLKTNQAPYLDPLYAMANAAPPGTRIETLSMNRKGDISLRAALNDSQQVVQLRSKLIESGVFSTVVVEEQTPSADRKKVMVRITAQWDPVAERKLATPGGEKPKIQPSSSKTYSSLDQVSAASKQAKEPK